MPTRDHDYLSDATKDTLKENVKAVADAWDCTERYVYQIIAEERRDPMSASAFLVGYDKLCKRGVSTEKYDREMAFSREKYSRSVIRQPGEAIQKQFHEFSRFTEEFMQGISDGSLDLAETERLLDILAILKPLVNTSESSLLAHKAKLEK